MIAGIILAAGESRRMGQLKPLLKIGEKTFLQYIIAQLRLAGIEHIVVVLGYKPEEILAHSGMDTHHIINNHYRLGQFSSLQTGIFSLPETCQGAVVCLGDQPQIRHEWIQALLTANEHNNYDIIIPQYNGRSGHPVFYASSLFAEITGMSPSLSARELYEKHRDAIYRVEVSSDGILYDADTPQDLEHIRQRFMDD